LTKNSAPLLKQKRNALPVNGFAIPTEPVVVYEDQLLAYPTDLNLLEKTRTEYFAKIKEALSQGWSFEKMRMAFRWLFAVYSLLTIELRRKPVLGNAFIERILRFLGHKTRMAWPAGVNGFIYINHTYFDRIPIH
jgi:hypothetical protein